MGLLLISLLLFSFPAHAQLVPCGGPTQKACDVNDLIQLGVNIYNFLLGLMASVAVIILVWAGIRMLIYQYDENAEDELKKAKLTVRRAIAGIVIIICAYLMVYTLLVVLGVGSGPGGDGTLRSFLELFGFKIGP